MKKKILIGLGILVILLALAGTVSARPAYGASCSGCHSSSGSFSGTIYANVHKFDGISAPTATVSCGYCHIQPPNGTANPYNMGLTSNGSLYNSTHRYNATTLASVKLAAPACGNCHADVINNDFTRLSGTPTYLTSTTCENCHKPKYDNWTNTLHRVMLTPKDKAMAMNLPEPEVGWANISYVIVTKFEFAYINTTGYFPAQNDAYETETKEFVNSSHAGAAYGTCGSCHTTNWNTSGDNSSLPGFYGTFSEPGIACERCHEPAGNGHQVVVNYSGDQCRECHTGNRHGTGWENGEHAPPPYENGSCMFCHSSFDQYKNQNVTIDNATGVSCGVCHNTHDITDNKYAATFSEGIFDATTWSEVANSKLSFFNATASYNSLTGGSTSTLTAGNDIFDDLSNTLLYPGTDTNRKDLSYGTAPINVTGPVSEVLCSTCHYRHGLAHIAGVNLSHGTFYYGEQAGATCTDCHMAGTNATVGKDMMKMHANDPLTPNSCGGTTKCHTTSAQDLSNSSHSVIPVINEWKASAHNDKQVSVGDDNYNHYYWNNTAGAPNSRQVSCNKCHSPMDWNPLRDSNTTNVPLSADFKGITCAVCHNLHDMGDWLAKTNATFGVPKAYAWYNKDAVVAATNLTTGAITRYKANYTMMPDTVELCGNCHSNIRIGNEGPGWNGSGGNPTGVHGFPAKDIFVGSVKQKMLNPATNAAFECIDCHMATMIKDSNGSILPDSQKVKGHSFKWNATILNGTACSNCHVTGSALGNLSTTVENIQVATRDKWNATNITVMDALATINAFTGPKDQSRDLIARAYWNLRLVSSDESWGVHDPVKVNNLLNESSTLANDALTALGSEGGNLSITSFSPMTPTVIDVLGGPTRTFSITVNQVANVSWQVNETEVANETGVTTSSYANGSAAEGTWNVTAVAENTNGSVMRNWIWTVSPQVAGYTISGFTINSENNLGVPGWEIDLTNDTMNVSTTTDENGMYQFTGLSNGTYTVTEMMQAGWTNITPTSIDVLIEGADVMDQNFKNTPPVVAGFSISGFKINNSNNLGVPGWEIDLTNETMNISATTDANGMYQFTGLANGTYTVSEMMQAGWTNVTPMSIEVLIGDADVMNRNFTNALIPVVTQPTSFLLTPDTSVVLKGTTININAMAFNGNLSMPDFNGMADINITANNLSAVRAPMNMSFENGNATIQVSSTVAQFVTVTATNGIITGSTTVEFADFVIPLVKGWNLVSIPSFANPSDINQTLLLVQNNGVQAFNPDTMLFVTPTDLQPLYGYWINVTADDQKLGFIADTNDIIVPPTRNLYEGWNLIGVSASETHPEDTVNAGMLFVSLKYGNHFTEQYYSELVRYDEQPPKTLVAGENDLTDLTDNTPLKIGHGYWLFIKNIPNTNENNVPWAGKTW